MRGRTKGPRRSTRSSLRRRTPPDWWDRFFGEDYVFLYGSALTPRLSAQQAEFAFRALSLSPGRLVLDLCCGFGRHIRWFRALGLRAYGIERSECQIASARPSERVRIVRGDARALPFRGGFDAAVCMYTSFGYFDDAGNRQQLTEAFRVLNDGGRLLIDNQNPSAYLDRLKPERRVRDEATQTTITEEFDYDAESGRLYSRKEVVTPERTREYFFALQTYPTAELARLLEEAGFLIESTWGDYGACPYSDSSRRLIIVARKPAR